MTARPQDLTPVQLQVLRMLNRFRFLTATQLNRLMWPGNTRDRNRHAQRQLHKLTAEKYALPVGKLPTPNAPTASLVYTVGPRGRKALLAVGETVPTYYRPSELSEAARNPLFMPHTLAVVDILIAEERLTRTAGHPQLVRLLVERDLRRLSLKTTVPPAGVRSQQRVVTVVPDALFSMDVAGDLLDFLVELDRGTERRQQWRDKVAALTVWVASPERHKLLTGPYVTVMVVTGTPERRDELRAWTEQELHTLGLFESQGHIYAITCASPVTLSPEGFFTQPHWYPPYEADPESLIDLPDVVESQEP